jgi:hypothetical protein
MRTSRSNLRVASTVVALSACALAPLASAQDTRTGGSGSRVRRLDEDLTSARAMALGGRAEAGGASTTALFGNPAAASSMRTYHVDSYTLYDPTVGRFAIGSGMIDSTRSVFTAGFAYSFTNIDFAADKRTVHDGRLLLGLNLGQFVGLGGRVRYLNASAGPLAPDAQGLDRGAFSGFTFDAGLHVHPAREFALSVTGYNLNNVNSTAAPIALGTGVALSPIREFHLVADALIDFRSTGVTRGRFSGGAELFISNKYAIRGGYLFDDTRGGSQAFTAGFGYVDPNFGVELSWRQAVVPDLQSTLMISLRYYYQAAAQQAQQAQQSAQSSSGL